MRPMALVAWGLVIVVLDLKFNEFDFVPDIVGWCMCVAGLAAVSRLSGWFTGALVGSILGLLVSVPMLVGASGDLLALGETVAHMALLFGTLSGVIAVLRVSAPEHARTANVIRWIDVGVTVLGLLVYVLDSPEPVLPLVIITLANVIWGIVLLLRVKDRPELSGRASVAA